MCLQFPFDQSLQVIPGEISFACVTTRLDRGRDELKAGFVVLGKAWWDVIRILLGQISHIVWRDRGRMNVVIIHLCWKTRTLLECL